MNPKVPDDPASMPDLKSLEAQLAALVPREDRLDRHRLMYLAGQASVQPERGVARRRRSRWGVPASIGAAAGALAASLLMMALAPRNTPSAPADDAARVELAETAVHGEAPLPEPAAWNFADLIESPAWRDAQLTADTLVRGPAGRNGRQHRDAEAVVNAAPPPVNSRPLTSRSFDDVLTLSVDGNSSS